MADHWPGRSRPRRPHCGPRQRGQTKTPEAPLPEFMLDQPDPREPARWERPDPAFWGPEQDDLPHGARSATRGRHRPCASGNRARTGAARRLTPRRMRLATATAIPATVVIGVVVYFA